MRRAAAALTRLRGWRRDLVAAAAGAVSVLALAPFHLWFALFLTLPVLVWLLDGVCAGVMGVGARARGAARVGWAFGFGYFLAGLHWVGHSFLVEAEIFAWAMPFAVFGLTAGLALFFAAGTALAGAMWCPGPARLAALALGLGLAEIARGQLFTGLPWNTLGYALAADGAMMQWASLFGVYGLSFLAAAIFTAPAAILEPGRGKSMAGTLWAAAMMGLLVGGWAWGKARLDAAARETVPDVHLRLVQPNIPQIEKWKPDNRLSVFRQHLRIGREGPAAETGGLEKVTHLVWPESALPFLLADSTQALAAIAELLPEGTVLLTGQNRLVDELNTDGSLNARRIYNSLFVMNDRAMIVEMYDKLHLVPFGEFLPFQETLEGLGLMQLTRVRGGFSPGTGQRILNPPGAPPAAALICYEVIFPHAIRAGETAPAWMLNVTNDAWFGASIGPYQHFHQARVRAVEQGLPLVRAANTGISAVVDPYGRIVASLPLGRQGALDSPLPAAAETTLFVNAGWLAEMLFSFTFALSWLILRSYRTRREDL